MSPFDQQLGAHERTLEKIRKGDLRQFVIVDVDCSAVGIAKSGGDGGVFEVEGNAITLLSRYYSGRDKKVYTSNQACSAMVTFNRSDNPGMPFSFSVVNGDWRSAVLTFQKFYVYVQDAAAGAHLYFAVLKGVNCSYEGTQGSY